MLAKVAVRSVVSGYLPSITLDACAVALGFDDLDEDLASADEFATAAAVHMAATPLRRCFDYLTTKLSGSIDPHFYVNISYDCCLG